MKKCVASLVVLVLVGTLQAAVVPNGDFELSVPGNGWDTYGTCTVAWDGDATNHYAHLSLPSGANNGLATGLVPVESMVNNLGYDFSLDAYYYWGHSTGWGACAEYYNSSQTFITWDFLIPERGNTSGWEHVTTHLASLPAGTAYIKIFPRINYYGQLCLDNVSFAATTPEPATMTMLALGLVGLLRRRK